MSGKFNQSDKEKETRMAQNLPPSVHEKVEKIYADAPKEYKGEYSAYWHHAIKTDPELAVIVKLPFNNPTRSGIYGYFGNKGKTLFNNGKERQQTAKNGNGKKVDASQTSFVDNLPRGRGVEGKSKYRLPHGVTVYIDEVDDQAPKIAELEKTIADLSKIVARLEADNQRLQDALTNQVIKHVLGK